MNETIAVVLAGGEGKRFWPLTMYKSMTRFLDKRLLVHNLEKLHKAGIRNVVVVANPNDAQNVRAITFPGMHLTVVVQPKPTGMANALLSARDAISGKPCFVMNAEDVVEQSLYDRVARETVKNQPFVVGKKTTEYFNGGYLKMDNDRLVAIIEKPGEGNEPSDLVNLVFHFFPDISEFLSLLAKTSSDKDDVYERAFSELIMHTKVGVVSYDGIWQPLKYPWNVLDIMHIFLGSIKSYRGKNIQIQSNVVIEGEVHIEDNVRIFENTKIVGPCYIGPNTIIGNNNIIRQSHIGAHCITGFNSDITRSYIGEHCWFHTNYVGDSVLEGNISMGAGAVLANLRLDDGEIHSLVKEQRLGTKRNKLGSIIGMGVRLGVNVSVMPGVKVGANSFVGAGVILSQDLPRDSFCIAKQEQIITKNAKQEAAQMHREEFRKLL